MRSESRGCLQTLPSREEEDEVNRRCGARAEGKLVCTMPSREEEKPAKQG